MGETTKVLGNWTCGRRNDCILFVLLRQVNGTPVMAHPPDVDSNLTLADFLNQTTASTKGIKLDFKTIVVVEPSLKMIKVHTIYTS